MSKELVIGSNRHEAKVAILEDDQLVEVYFQRANEYSLAGSIHKGRVTRVLPGMQSAFVDLGLERDTFLYVSDFFEENEDIDTVAEEKPVRNERRDRNFNRQPDRPTVAQQQFQQQPQREQAVSQEPISSNATADAQAETGGSGEAQPSNESDRNFRGDRRNRRSRRRRGGRGHGFPESKYAQPNDGHEASPVSAAEPEEDLPEQDEPAADVIILPGESLAKYRHAAPVTAEQPEAQPLAEAEPEPASLIDEDLEQQAQEIELVDKVFSHHDDSAMEEEEKMAEVRNDVPVEPLTASGLPADEGTVREAIEEPEIPAVSHEEPPQGSNIQVSAGVVESEQEIHPVTHVTAPEAGEPEDGISATDTTEALLEETLELDESDEDESTAEDTTVSDSGEGQSAEVQTASVREQGGRYPHRASRRMRRRRGGNRFGSENRESSNEGGPITAAGAAPALEPEVEERSAEKPERVYPSITELLKSGQEIIVQIAKEPLGQKGARITSHIALPGRYVVFMPSVGHLGVSRKIASDEERQRLKRALMQHRPGTTGGFIVRTAGEGVSEEEIAADMDFLYKLWLDIRQKAEKKPAPALLHYDLDIVQRILRDQVTDEFKAIWVDSEEMYENVLSFMQRFQPRLVNRVKMYTREAPIFDAFEITSELEKALRPKVWLKSGGYIVINQTEALVAIDINTGKYVGKSNRLEDTIVKTNVEAVQEIVRQIRLRDLGGIIVVDFIDMDERKNRQKVMQALEDAMRSDRAPNKILQFNDFGLVAITRKRVKQSLERTLCAPCPYCEGAGYVKSVQTVISEILVEAQKIAKAIEGKNVLLRVHPDVAKVLKSSENKYLEELEDILGRPVMVKGDPSLHHEKFDLG